MSLNQLINPSGAQQCTWANYECYNLTCYQGITATNMNITNMSVQGLTATTINTNVINGITGNINIVNSNVVNGITANINIVNSNVVNGITGNINNLETSKIDLFNGSNKNIITSSSLSSNINLSILDSKVNSHLLTGADSNFVVQSAPPFTSVIANGKSGVITTANLTLAPFSSVDFPVINNCLVNPNHTILTTIQRYSGILGLNGLPIIYPTYTGVGTYRIYVYNSHPTNALNGTLDISFLIA